VKGGCERGREVEKMERRNGRDDEGDNERKAKGMEGRIEQNKGGNEGRKWERIRKELNEVRVEREEVKEKIRRIKRRMEDMERENKRGELIKVSEGERDKGEVEQMLKKIKRKLKRKGKRGNLIIRGLEVKKEKRKEAMEKLMSMIGVEIKIREVWRIAGEKEKERAMVGIKVEGVEKRREILQKRGKN